MKKREDVFTSSLCLDTSPLTPLKTCPSVFILFSTTRLTQSSDLGAQKHLHQVYQRSSALQLPQSLFPTHFCGHDHADRYVQIIRNLLIRNYRLGIMSDQPEKQFNNSLPTYAFRRILVRPHTLKPFPRQGNFFFFWNDTQVVCSPINGTFYIMPVCQVLNGISGRHSVFVLWGYGKVSTHISQIAVILSAEVRKHS